MTWQKEIDELNQRRELAKQMGGAENIAKQHARGKLTLRERLDLLLDPNSMQEVRGFIGNAEYDDNSELKSFMPANIVICSGKIDGRPVCVRGDDATILGGSSDVFGLFQSAFVEKMAQWRRSPMIKLLDGAGGSVREVSEHVGTIPPGVTHPQIWNEDLLSQVPVVSAVLGSCAGWIAVTAVISHFSVMTRKTSELFTGGPPVVKRALNIDIKKQDLGDYRIHTFESGVIDNVAEDEEDAFRQVRLFLSYLPQNVWHLPPRIETGDDPDRRDEELLSIIPRSSRRQYDMRQLIRHVVDKDSIFELSPSYGRSLITALARMDGYPVALMANDCKWDGGAQTPDACEKMARFVDMADTFHLPIIYLADVPGFMLGPESEKRGIIRKSARAIFAVNQSTVPYLSIVVRRQYGVAAFPVRGRPDYRAYYAWPSAEIGSIPAEGGVTAAYRKEIEASSDPAAKRIEIENRIKRLGSVLRRANSFIGVDIIDPRDTRPLLCDFVKEAQETTATQLGIKSRAGIRP